MGVAGKQIQRNKLRLIRSKIPYGPKKNESLSYPRFKQIVCRLAVLVVSLIFIAECGNQ